MTKSLSNASQFALSTQRVMVRLPVLAFVMLSMVATVAGAAPLKEGGRALGNRIAPPPSQLIVRFRDEQARGERVAMTVPRVDGLSKTGRTHLLYRRPMVELAHVFRFAAPVTRAEAEVVAARLRLDPAVAEVEIDDYLFPLFEPNDAFYTNTTIERMWHLKAPTALRAGGVNLPAAWDITRGGGAVVAVIDSGIFNHADLEPNILRGHDFVGADSIADGGGFLVANDGDGRDADPSDPGDWITAGDQAKPIFATCDVADSSWHGTHVAGTVAAVGNNGTGTVGVAFESKVLAVRVLGKCFGYGADISDAIWWAAGGVQPETSQATGLPTNPSPAKVINLSLGSTSGSCATSRQNAINAARDAGAVVVVATGNDGLVSISSPANCQGVIAVTAHTVEGNSASYANVGPGTAISAPGGGDCAVAAVNCLPQGSEGVAGTIYRLVLSTSSDGTRGPATGRPVFLGEEGTSMAAPHVSGVAALLYARMPTLKPDTVKGILTASARPFPSGTYCAGFSDGRCGTGMLDAKRALDRLADLTPTVTAAAPAAIVRNGSAVTLTATATAKPAGLQSLSYAWQQLSGPAVTLANATTLQPSFTAPSPGAAISFRFTASAADGLSASTVVNLRANGLPSIATPPAPPAATTGSPVSFRVTGTDPDGDPVAFGATGVPSGATFNGTTGEFSWLNATPAGTYTISITPSDGFETGAVSTVTVTVNDPPRSGGGSMDLLGLALLGLWGLARCRSRRGAAVGV
jgi:serine protease